MVFVSVSDKIDCFCRSISGDGGDCGRGRNWRWIVRVGRDRVRGYGEMFNMPWSSFYDNLDVDNDTFEGLTKLFVYFLPLFEKVIFAFLLLCKYSSEYFPFPESTHPPL